MKWKIHTKERNKALEWFGKNASHFKFGGGSTQQFIFHAQQNAIERTFPSPAERMLTVSDLETALKLIRAVKRTNDALKPIIKRAANGAMPTRHSARKKRNGNCRYRWPKGSHNRQPQPFRICIYRRTLMLK